MLYGFLLTASVSVPPSSYPTYHAGEPISFEALCFSINSDISTLISAFSSPKYSFAKSFARYVLPTPEGPIKRSDAIGLFFCTTESLFLLIDFTTASTASCCPTIFQTSSFSSLLSLSVSDSVTICAGTPILSAKTRPIS